MDIVDRTERIAAATDTGTKERLWVQDDWQPFPILKVSVDALVMNIENRRFAAERRLFEGQLGHGLDPENSEEDALSVEAILLDKDLQVDGDRVVGKPGKDYHALRKDWVARDQESPFWIRPDGMVQNGNRRLAMLRRIQREEGAAGYEYVHAVVLDPEAIDEVTLFEMEQREQLTEDYKVRYTDINLLLAIKDAADDKGIDWFDDESIETVAGALQHVMRNNKNYALVQLYAIRYMDAFLDDMDQSEQYDKLMGQIERFRDIGRAMRLVEGDDPAAAPNMLEVCFAAVRAGLPHGEIRKIRRMYSDSRTLFDELIERVRAAESGWEPSPGEDSLTEPDVVDLEDGEEEDAEAAEAPGPIVSGYPEAEVKSEFDDSIDQYEASQSDDVRRTLSEVVNRLVVIAGPEDGPLVSVLEEDEGPVQSLLEQIFGWVDEHRPLLP